MTLLSSVQKLHRQMRKDPPDEIAASDLFSNSLVDLLNDAADALLNAHSWSFLQYDDGQAFFPAKETLTTGVTITSGSPSVQLNVAGANSWATANVTDFGAGRLLARLRITDDSTHSNTSYPIATLSSAALFPATLRNTFRGSGGSGLSAEVYAHEIALPVAHRDVHSCRFQEDRLPMTFVSRHNEMDTLFPRVTDVFRDRPDAVYVGGVVNATTTGSADTVYGPGMAIWPPPDADIVVDYSYTLRIAALSADTDAWDGVPAEAIALIEQMALEKAYLSDLSNDPVRASQLAAINRERREALLRIDSRSRGRRYVPRELGGPNPLGRDYQRWPDLTVPSP